MKCAARVVASVAAAGPNDVGMAVEKARHGVKVYSAAVYSRVACDGANNRHHLDVNSA